MKYIITGVLLLLAGCQESVVPTAATDRPAGASLPPPTITKEGQCFSVIDATLYTGKPDMHALGVRSIQTTNPGQWWKAAPDMSQKDAVLMNAALSGDAPVVLDMELPLPANRQLYVDLLSWMRLGGNTAPLAYYSILPIRNYWGSLGASDSPAYKAWQAQNDTMQPLVASVAALYPSLYTFYDNPTDWVTYALANIAEARRMAGGKPVYPFLWPQYHNSAPADLRFQYIDSAYWEVQLQTVYEHADGLVIWGGWDYANDRSATWDDNAAWWLATKRLIASIPNLCAP